MLTESVLVAIITGAFTLIGTWLMHKKKSQDDAVKQAVKEQIKEDKLANIERKLDIHNGYAKKLDNISKSIVAIKKDIQYLKESRK